MKWLTCTMAALMGICGCAVAPRAGSSVREPPNQASAFMLDHCADRLQEICGLILEYYAVNRKLPGAIEQLQALAVKNGEPEYLFACPVSHRLYIYNSTGVPLPGMSPAARVVLYDAEPVHGGHRWGVAVSAVTGNHPLIAKVVQLPDGLIKP